MQEVIEMPVRDGAELEQKALTAPEYAKALKVSNNDTFVAAAEYLKAIKALLTEAEVHHRPIINAAHATHKAALAALKKITDPLSRAETIVKRSIAAYQDEQRKLQIEAERKAREEAERRRQEEIEAQIEEAEAEGASVREVEAIIQQSESMPLVVAQPKLPAPPPPKVAGVTTRKMYAAVVKNKAAFLAAVANNPTFHALVDVNEGALNKMANALGGVLKIDGVEVEERTIVAAGRR